MLLASHNEKSVSVTKKQYCLKTGLLGFQFFLVGKMGHLPKKGQSH
jgi:hypothetical protein